MDNSNPDTPQNYNINHTSASILTSLSSWQSKSVELKSEIKPRILMTETAFSSFDQRTKTPRKRYGRLYTEVPGALYEPVRKSGSGDLMSVRICMNSVANLHTIESTSDE